jgi:6,7-dimethyl-8-ribityllumazine synthase
VSLNTFIFELKKLSVTISRCLLMIVLILINAIILLSALIRGSLAGVEFVLDKLSDNLTDLYDKGYDNVV